MFDCIIPSQLARRGVAFTCHGKLQLRRTVYKFSENPIDARCDCQTCRHYSRAYMHHLIKSDEMLGWHLLGFHNMAFYHRLMQEMRESILRDDFQAYYAKNRRALSQSDDENPSRPPKKTKSAPRASLGNYEIYDSQRGFATIRQISSGEIMHSVNSPSDEATKLYVEQSVLGSRLLKNESPENELVIWDVGLGAAWNAMAAVGCFEKCFAEKGADALRLLRLVSFECDLDSLALAAENTARFAHLRHGAPLRILDDGEWWHASGLLHWRLVEGDFRDSMASASIPELIFYDPFSAKTDAALWTVEVFRKIYQICSPKSAELYTYSASTAARAALLAAGFFAAEGAGTGPKSTTTIAFTTQEGAKDHPLSPRLLGQDWLARWRRSDAKYPATLANEEKPHFEMLIETHRQFFNDF